MENKKMVVGTNEMEVVDGKVIIIWRKHEKRGN